MTGTGFAYPRVWTWLAIALVACWLVWLLSPNHAPFLAGAIFAYMLNPLVNRLSGRYTSRRGSWISSASPSSSTSAR